jgi:hypothetical protein
MSTAGAAAVAAAGRALKPGAWRWTLDASSVQNGVLHNWVMGMWKRFTPALATFHTDADSLGIQHTSADSLVTALCNELKRKQRTFLEVRSDDGYYRFLWPWLHAMLKTALDANKLQAMPLVDPQELLSHSPTPDHVQGPVRLDQMDLKDFTLAAQSGCPRLIEWTCDGRTCNTPAHAVHSGRGMIGTDLFLPPDERKVFMDQRRAFLASIRKHFENAIFIHKDGQIGQKRKRAVKEAQEDCDSDEEDTDSVRTCETAEEAEEDVHAPKRQLCRAAAPAPNGVAQFIPKDWLAHAFRYLDLNDLAAVARSCRAWNSAVFSVPIPEAAADGAHMVLLPGSSKQLSQKRLALRHLTRVSGRKGRGWTLSQLNQLKPFTALQSISICLLTPKSSTLSKLRLPLRLTSLSLDITQVVSLDLVQHMLDQLPQCAPNLTSLEMRHNLGYKAFPDASLKFAFVAQLPALKQLHLDISLGGMDWTGLEQEASLESVFIGGYEPRIIETLIPARTKLLNLRTIHVNFFLAGDKKKEELTKQMQQAFPHASFGQRPRI